MRFELKADVDKVIEITRTRKVVNVDQLAEELNWTPDRVRKIARVATMVSKSPKLALSIVEGSWQVYTSN